MPSFLKLFFVQEFCVFVRVRVCACVCVFACACMCACTMALRVALCDDTQVTMFLCIVMV